MTEFATTAMKAESSLSRDTGEIGEINSPKISRELSVLLENLPDQVGELDWLDSLPDEIGEQLPANSAAVFYKLGTATVIDALSDAYGYEHDPEEGETEKKGGSYRDVYKEGEGNHSEVHHIPADSVSPLERNDGPAIKMDKGDHRQTASCGNSREAQEYRAAQADLISKGKFRDAVQMDIDDIRDKFGDKYEDAIAEMLKYIDKLELEGKI